MASYYKIKANKLDKYTYSYIDENGISRVIMPVNEQVDGDYLIEVTEGMKLKTKKRLVDGDFNTLTVITNAQINPKNTDAQINPKNTGL